jgi:hypothetical protein
LVSERRLSLDNYGVSTHPAARKSESDSVALVQQVSQPVQVRACGTALVERVAKSITMASVSQYTQLIPKRVLTTE